MEDGLQNSDGDEDGTGCSFEFNDVCLVALFEENPSVSVIYNNTAMNLHSNINLFNGIFNNLEKFQTWKMGIVWTQPKREPWEDCKGIIYFELVPSIKIQVYCQQLVFKCRFKEKITPFCELKESGVSSGQCMIPKCENHIPDN